MMIMGVMMKKTSIGGQALIEGLMMIGPQNAAIAIRKADGEIVIDKRELPKKILWSKIPIIRGSVNFFRQMILGVKALMYSASFVEIEEEEEVEETGFDRALKKISSGIKKVFGQKIHGKIKGLYDKFESLFEGNKIPDFMIYISVIISIFFSVGLFIIFPRFVTQLIAFSDTTAGNILDRLFEGVLRIFLFFGYLYVVSYMKDIKRVWQYHGAEHKTINCYENGDDLTVANVRKHTTQHPRCGTSFMFIVMIIAMLIFSVIPRYDSMLITISLRIILLPLVAGLSYEILKFVGRRTELLVMKILSKPGMALQAFTTREPDDDQIEVAIVAFNNVLVDDKKADEW
jgi:uncharacterized protein YqhQ